MLALWLGIAWPALAGGPFVINGKLAGVEDGAVVRLFRPDGSMGAAVAADTLRNGRFMLCGEVEQLEMLSIAVQGEGFPSMGLNVWVEPDAVVSVSGRDKLLVTWKVASKIPQQAEANRYIDASRSEYVQMQQAAVEFSALAGEADRARRSRLLKRMDSLQMLIRKAEIEILQQTPVSEIWLDKLRNQAVAARIMKDYPYREEVLALYEKLPQQQRETSRGRSIRLNLFPPPVVQPGDEMADADLLDTLGHVHRLADYKGKYLLLDFWSIGCGPCRMAMPEMRRMGEVYRDVLTVISITQDGETSWKKYSAEQGIEGVNLRDPESLTGLSVYYGVKGIPHYVLISPEGKVITSWTGYAAGQLEKKLDELLPDSVGRPFVIEGNLQGVEDGLGIGLGRVEPGGIPQIGQDTIRGGKFRFSGLLNGPTHMVLMGDPRQGFSFTRLDFWAGPGRTTVAGDDKMIRSWRAESDLPEQTEQNRYADACRNAVHRQQQCMIEIRQAGRVQTPQTDSLWAEYQALQRLVDSVEIAILQTLPEGVTPSAVWMDKLSTQASNARYAKDYPYRDVVVGLYEALSDSQKGSPEGIEIGHRLYPRSLKPGDMAPDGVLADPSGKSCRLADFRTPDKYMLLDFWRVACAPCHKSVPEMKEVVEEYRDRLTVVAVNLDGIRDQWLKAAAKDGITWTNLNDPQGFEGLPFYYDVFAVPTYVLISPAGKVSAIWSGYGPGLLKKNVAEAFAKADAASGLMSAEADVAGNYDDISPVKQAGTYVIEGHVTGVAAGAVFFLMDLDFEGGSSIARDTLRDGTFRFTGSVEAPVKIGLSSQAISTMLECWIGPGATTAITGEGPFPAAWKIESDLPEQTESNRYDEVSREMSLLRQQYHAEFMSIYNKLDLSKDSVPPRLFSLQTSRDSAARIAASRELELLAVSPVSTVWMDRFVSQVQRVSSSTKSQGRDTVLTLYDRLGDGWKQSEPGRYIALKLFPPKAVGIGDEFADGELFDTTGAVRYLADFRSEGKYMVLDFWHSACRACLEAIPEMNEVGEQYKDKLVIVGITLDRSPEVWKRTLAGHRVSWPGLRTAEGKVGLAAKYKVNGTPRYVMISPEGRVVALWGGYGPGTFRKEVEKVLQPADMR
ncbi:hypothetical protein KML24004_14350 [Alistipes indistinctus]